MNKNEEELHEFFNKIDFNCQKCSLCCRIDPGAVFLTKDDVYKISAHLSMDEKVFLKEYCRTLYKGFDMAVSLKEKSNYDCIFWDKKCKIYEVRPVQCKTYPFWPSIVSSEKNWAQEADRCKGINKKSNLTVEDKMNLYKLDRDAKNMILKDHDHNLNK